MFDRVDRGEYRNLQLVRMGQVEMNFINENQIFLVKQFLEIIRNKKCESRRKEDLDLTKIFIGDVNIMSKGEGS